MTEFMEYVFQEKTILFRIRWFNEVKTPMLTTCILFDNGSESLDQRMQELRDIVVNNVIPALPGDSTVLTHEETYMKIATKNKKAHARAKMII